MNIIVPLAGKDENFESLGMIKPLTKIQGKEIIKIISESRPFSYEKAIVIDGSKDKRKSYRQGCRYSGVPPPGQGIL